jgi:AmpD protein
MSTLTESMTHPLDPHRSQAHDAETQVRVDAEALWQNGWYGFAKRVPSPHHGERPNGAVVDLIVLHSISLPPGQYGGELVVNFLAGLPFESHDPYVQTVKDLKVAPHFLIRRGGELIQFVSTYDRAWHAGVSSYRGRDNCNDDSIGIELEGLEGESFEDAQYETLTGLCAAIAQLHPICHVAGHEHIAPGRKKDPGAKFSWQYLQRSLGWQDRYFP